MDSKKGIDETCNMKTNEQLTIFTRPFVMALLATMCCFLWGSAFPAFFCILYLDNFTKNATNIIRIGDFICTWMITSAGRALSSRMRR